MGFREGNILEPSCGIGNFIGMLPQSMQDSKIYGVEIDKISAGIAQQLYQKTSIAAQPFEEANIPDSFFDAVIGNVPFGDIRVNDRRYNKHNFLIHDYFFAKSLDKLRPGGVMALITSKGTMDKENPAVRKYIAQRADLLGAIRLPNNTFKGNAGTEVVSDILILQKRDRLIDLEPEWVHLNTDENGVKMNTYFVDHPEMVLGEWKTVSGRFGEEDTVVPYENADLAELLEEAISNIHAEITDYEVDEELTEEDNSIPADPEVRNFSYTVVDDKIYYRENSRMAPVDVSATAENRIKGMIAIRDCVRNLIEMQTADYPDYEVEKEQQKLNELYDTFSKKYGLINSRANVSAFSQDSSFALLSALEVLDENGELERKADMFTKRTIKPHTPVTSVDTASEALAVSMGEKACVDMEYMCSLTGKTEQEIYGELKGVIFLNPMYGYGNSTERKYLMADEYLSGNVREKLAWAKKSAEVYPEDYNINVEALEKVQPKDLTASEIFVQLGTTWLPEEIAQQFMYEFLDTPVYARWNIKVHYSKLTGEWNVEGKSYDRGNLKAYNTYGTKRVNAYKIIEDTLNMKDVRVFDYIEDDEGKKKAVLNKKETAIAQSKQELIKQGFQDWVWRDPARREKLVRLYNDKFNSIRPREYDGSHIIFSGMNPEIELREHQKNAVAHILYGGNTLLAHAVGAGKTFEMTAAAMESKRLGLCNKSLFVVPNHLTEQWAAEFLQLYPAANILVATKKDFEMKNRKRFCGRIATGDYDAVIIGHSQFEKIPISIERQRAVLQQQLDDIIEGIAEAKRNRGDRFSVKQLEKTKKSLQTKLEKLNDQSRKDDVVTFEELGIDRLFIDESHYYKNLYLYTKMRNVGGIAQTEAQKSSDLFMKCRYLDEITGGRGVVFATGTPISNSMVELYTIQRYLQYRTLQEHDLQHFDAWASMFGETVTAVELTPEGTGYRAKTRFAKFNNLPELMAMFKQVADIKTADMLDLPVPEVEYHNIAVKPSQVQKEMVASLGERAEKIRGGNVDSSVDNLLYGMGIGIYLSTRRNYRRREEHGSAKWGSAKAIDKKYRQSPPSENKLMTQNVRIGLNAKKHRRNLNTLVCGGSGAGKTRFYCKPNLMQTSNSSQVILDPKGEILRDVGNLLEKAGYEIKVLDLISMEKSHCYNPFVYLRNDNDIQRLVTNLFKSTTPKGSQSNDPFWDTAASMLLLALVFYLHYEAPEEEQNFAMVMEMLRAAAIEDEEDNRPSPLDNLFADLEMDNPDHIALKYYRSYHSGSAKTLKSIQITLAARLEKFNLESLAALTSADELDLASMGEKKTALFALIPDNDSSFNFLVSILYTQLFQQLFYSADHIHGGSLPIPVHFLMDEFANVSLPDDFDKILSVMRSRGVSVSIILQNLAQLKALFEKQWESIVGNCDEFLYLGGNEQSTHKYVSEVLGKETIDTNTYGKSEGRSGNYSTNYQISGRELLTPDEVRMLDNRYAILFIRGELPVMDLKYDILKHPNVAYTADGKGGVYQHGEVTKNVATIETLYVDLDSVPEMELSETTYELLSDEDFENLTN